MVPYLVGSFSKLLRGFSGELGIPAYNSDSKMLGSVWVGPYLRSHPSRSASIWKTYRATGASASSFQGYVRMILGVPIEDLLRLTLRPSRIGCRA